MILALATWLLPTIGWSGGVCTLVAYLLLIRRRISAASSLYLSLNLLGSACLALSTSAAHAWPSAAVNVIWLGIGLGPLARTSLTARAARRSTHADSSTGLSR